MYIVYINSFETVFWKIPELSASGGARLLNFADMPKQSGT